MRFHQQYVSEGKEPVSAGELQRMLLTRSIHPQRVLPLLLYWGGYRTYICETVPYEAVLTAEKAEALLHPYVRDLPFYNAIGTPYTIQLSMEDRGPGYKVWFSVLVGTKQRYNEGWHWEQGRNYRYPECCIEAFERNRALESPSPWILHSVCQKDCTASHQQALEYATFVRKWFPEVAAKLETTTPYTITR